MMTRRRALLAWAATALVTTAGGATLAGCKDRGQKSSEDARADAQKLVDLTAKDVEEVERGLPVGAKKLTELLAKEVGKDGDPKQNVPAVRSALLKMRQQVPDLGIAKSTFFAFADDKGIAVRNDFEHDTMAGKDLVKGWPGIKPVIEGAPYAATTGQFPGTPNPAGPDREWVAAVPVKKADGGVLGMLVTGWTYRRFAYHLQVTLQRDLQDQLMRSDDKGKMPIVYVCLFDKDHVYGAGAPGAVPVPEVNEKALAEVGLHAKTEAGPASSPLKITDREFGWAAARLPKLGPDVGVVVLRSDL
ncbi:MAG: hypothetical protein KF764_08785 [Labilithrix sp.]|nr:hypothetical protein [Labilithrix sp.]MBX3224289.1 hypothetical protein [Labilithrix sp.]